MASRDILDQLFEVERQAEALVEAARAEVDTLAGEAKETERLRSAAAIEKANAEASAARLASRAAAEDECRRLLDAYRARIESLPVDRDAFRERCDRALEELFP
ncbi:MAG TPA: hypothetical protein VMC79_02780 [Rectinemataceae bacterium]|nr:hypothetical protein [Rectinemataceae bacterium]